jgi:ACT domain-containing protein
VKLTDEELRKITLDAISELGDKASPELVKNVVAKAVEKYETGEVKKQNGITDSGRVILTSFGMNHPGIVAGITKTLSETECDIQDISQKIMGDFYTMIMIIDISFSPKTLNEIQEELNKLKDELKIKIYLQHEDVFLKMHRI